MFPAILADDNNPGMLVFLAGDCIFRRRWLRWCCGLRHPGDMNCGWFRRLSLSSDIKLPELPGCD